MVRRTIWEFCTEGGTSHHHHKQYLRKVFCLTRSCDLDLGRGDELTMRLAEKVYGNVQLRLTLCYELMNGISGTKGEKLRVSLERVSDARSDWV